ncbi:hypothetical protein HOO65_050479 [Ceratocystis lukuohia]|uniref:CCHC-type domain-containing protein n=1 Tax=Ceratocystis lukuohia TaxID=2019550 RepID=A0ABR4MGD3_9PEZI
MMQRTPRRGLRRAKAASLEPERDSRLRPSAPFKEKASLSEPSTPRSPKAPLEAITTSKNPERENRWDQSSAQVFILETLKSIVGEIRKARLQAASLRADMQVLQRSHQTIGKRRKSGKRHCGKCGRTNHNARTCRVAPKIPAEERKS